MVNQEKSRLTTLAAGFAFLGFEFRKAPGRMLLMWPREKACRNVRQRVREVVRSFPSNGQVGVVILAQSLSLVDIVDAQADTVWYILLQPVAFVIFAIAAVAETNRAPFDLPEAESELVGGYHTEYGGLKFAMFFLAEYVNMIIISAFGATLFLGGFSGPLLPGWLWLAIKVAGMLFVFIWLRATLPRLRYDRLMKFGWKVLLPVATLNLVVTAVVVALGFTN